MTIATAFTVIIPVIASVSIPSVIAIISVIAAVTMSFAIDRCVVITVPAILYKIGRMAAGIVATAIALPVFGMAWRYTQIKRLVINAWMAMHDDRVAIYQSGLRIGVITNIDTAVKSRLTDTD
jgi:hypothetical protein